MLHFLCGQVTTNKINAIFSIYLICHEERKRPNLNPLKQ